MLRRERGQATAEYVGVLLLVAAIVGTLVTAGCGEPQRTASRASALTRAESTLQAELEAVVDRLGMPAEPGERVPPVRCDDGARHDVTSGYRIRLKLHGDGEAQVERAAAFWRRRGRHVRVVSRRGAFPAVFATDDPGWTFALQLFPERREAILSGGTPCLPDPEA